MHSGLAKVYTSVAASAANDSVARWNSARRQGKAAILGIQIGSTVESGGGSWLNPYTPPLTEKAKLNALPWRHRRHTQGLLLSTHSSGSKYYAEPRWSPHGS